MSRSYVSGTVTVAVIASVNPVTVVATVASCNGLSVSPQRAGSPNRSTSRACSSGAYVRSRGSIRIWVRRAIECTRRPVSSATRRSNSSVGPAAKGSGRAPVQANRTLELPREGLQLREVGVDGRPRLAAAVEAAPVQLDQADEPVAGVDRHEQARHPAPHEHRLDVGLQLGGQASGPDARAPGVEGELALRGPGRAG